jgi:hypothetical protein
MTVYLYFFTCGWGFRVSLEIFWGHPTIVYSFSYYRGWAFRVCNMKEKTEIQNKNGKNRMESFQQP